jgi:hypothetical protein
MTENNKLGMIHKQTTAFTKKLSQYLLERNMKNKKNKKHNQDNLILGEVLNTTAPQYELEIPASMQYLFYAIGSMLNTAVFMPQSQKWFATNITALNISYKSVTMYSKHRYLL